MITVEQLLEQYHHYNLEDGFTLGRNHNGWNIYYRAKHVDLMDDPQKQDGFTSFPNAVAALRAYADIRALSPDWCPSDEDIGDQCVTCSMCGKRVSQYVKVVGLRSPLIVRAFVQCPECSESAIPNLPEMQSPK